MVLPSFTLVLCLGPLVTGSQIYLCLMFLQVREVQLPHQEFGELLCFLVSLFAPLAAAEQVRSN